MASPKEAHVAKRAYEIWEDEGRPHGRDREHWLKAVAEFSAVAEPVAKLASAAAPKASTKTLAGPGSVAAKPAPKAREAVTAPARTKSAPKKK